MSRIGVMQITDSLAAGGLERVAVNVANGLPADNWRSYLCTTRQGGPLEAKVAPHVKCVQLGRTGRFDVTALRKLSRYIKEHRIDVLHAHGTSLFIAAAVSMFNGSARVIWHDHFGRFETEKRSPAYRLATRNLDAVISVTEPLAQWAKSYLGMRSVWYIPNFVSSGHPNREDLVLPGEIGSRVVCVANFRRQKDHITLLRAFALVVREAPQAHLILLGSATDSECRVEIEQAITRLNLLENVSWLGSHSDVPAVLARCDIGVLSSRSEGLPLALLEYGMSGLPTVATNVGECAEVLGYGSAGIIVPASSVQPLADGICLLLRSREMREILGQKFRTLVTQNYSGEASIKQVCDVYYSVLDGGRPT